jgi:signal transduction histidine kinase
MKLRKLNSPIFFVLYFVFSLLVSCNKQEKNNEQELAIKKATKFKENQEYDSAFYYFNKANQFNSNNDKNSLVISLLNMTEIQQIQCDFSGSEATVTEALEINKEAIFYPNIYNAFGIAYEEQANYDEAINYYNKAILSTPEELSKAILQNNIGVAYLEKRDYAKAIKTFLPLLKKDALIKEKLQFAKVLDNLGYTYFKSNNSQAFNLLNQAVTIRDSIKDKYELISSYIHLSEYYEKTNPKLGKEFALKGYAAATQVNSPDDRIEALKYLIVNSPSEQTKELALKQITLSDSITKIRQRAKNQYAKIKYDSKKITLENEKNKNLKTAFLLLLLIVVAGFIAYYFINKLRNKRKLQAATYETETRISKKLHDELANDMYNAMTFAETQDLYNPDKKEALLDNLDKIYSRTRNISRENSEIDTGINFERNLKEMLSSYKTSNINIIISNSQSIDWSKINKEHKIAVYRVLQELMVNMKKHSQSSHVLIGFENQKNALFIKYSDNGIGCSNLLKNKKGLQNAENRILAIKGTLTFETETKKGFKVTMIVPK